MPFNGSGGTTQPSGSIYPAIANTLIESAKANASIADIYTMLASVICKDGQTTITANIPFAGFYATNVGIRAINGSVSTPGIAFNNETDCGFYLIGANNIGLSLAGAKVVDFSTTGVSVTGTFASSGALTVTSGGLTVTAGGLTVTAGGLTVTAGTSTFSGAIAGSPANANVTFSPTGTGTVAIAPATAGTINNMAIGGSTPAAGAFTTLSATGAMTYGGVPLNAAVTGTGNMVLSASPTLTGTLTAAAANFGGAVSVDYSVNGDATFLIDNDNTGSSARSLIQLGDSTSDVTGLIFVNGTNNSGGIGGARAMVVGTGGNLPLVLISNAAEVARATSTGLAVTGVGSATYSLESTGALQTNAASKAVLSYEGSGKSAITAFGVDTSTHGFLSLRTAKSNGATVEQVRVLGVDSATRYLTLTGSNGGSPTIAASAGSVQIAGSSTNDAAAAGYVGEYVQSTVTSVTVNTASVTNITSISLTAGDWDVSGGISNAGVTTQNNVRIGISQTSASFSGTVAGQSDIQLATNTTSGVVGGSTPSFRISLSGTKTIYLVGQVGTANLANVNGSIQARRAR